MLRILTLLISVTLSSLSNASLILQEDDGHIPKSTLRQTFSLPTNYNVYTVIPSDRMAKRWYLMTYERPKGYKPFGSITITAPDQDNVSDLFVAFDHRNHFSSAEKCMEAVSKLLLKTHHIMFQDRDFGHPSILRVVEIFGPTFEFLKYQGWTVSCRSKLLGSKQGGIYEYNLDLEKSIPERLAASLSGVVKLKAKL